jgi:hypothetical protein
MVALLSWAVGENNPRQVILEPSGRGETGIQPVEPVRESPGCWGRPDWQETDRIERLRPVVGVPRREFPESSRAESRVVLR